MTKLSHFLQESTALHRHLCPRQVLGVRMGMLAGQILDLQLPQRNKRLFVFMETDGCAADGVSVATGCWIGRRTMRLLDFGKVAATFVNKLTLDAFRIHAHPEARKRATVLYPQARSHWHAQLEAYQLIPDEELLVARPVSLQVDLEAIISRAGIRAQCQACGEEIINQRESIHGGSVLCRACAGEAYYTLIAVPAMELVE